MSAYPDDRRYTKSHEWIRLDGDVATVGISDHAQKELGEIVFVELPEVGEIFDANEEFGTIESVKAVSELFLPVAGEILELNKVLADEPGAVNEDPHGDGWLVKIKISSDAELDELMNGSTYEKFIEEEAKKA
jgi:glycine cleavage system H protein